jgi:hypothetical protein
MKNLTLISFLFSAISLNAQPGFIGINKNINYYTPAEIKESNLQYSYRQFLYILDSTTDVSKLRNLRSLNHITLVANVKVLPKELSFLSDSLKSITIDAGSMLVDMTSIKELKNVETITISKFDGVRLPDLSQLKKLKKLVIDADFYKHDNLRNISDIGDCLTLITLEIHNSSIENFDLDLSKINLERLEIFWCNSLKNIDKVTTSISLKMLRIYGTLVYKLPEHMSNMQSLEELSLTDMHKLESISSLIEMRSLQAFSLYISNTQLTGIPKAFSTNSLMKSIHIEVSYGRSLIFAEGITHLRNLESLVLRYAKFHLPEDFYTCENLDTVELVGLDSINVSRIHDFHKLRKLNLSACSFFSFPKGIYTNENVKDLTIAGNHKIEDLSDIVRFKKLNKLSIEINDNLKKIPDFKDKIPSFQHLVISGNKNLTLPDTYKSLINKFGYIDITRSNVN